MDDSLPPPFDPLAGAARPPVPPPPHANLLTRTIAFIIDWVVVSLLMCVLAGPLFYISGGALQTPSLLLHVNFCNSVKSIPDGLAPPPPENSTFARQCQAFTISGQAARQLIVGKTIVSESKSAYVTTKSETEDAHAYFLDAEGLSVRGVRTDLIQDLLLFGYLVTSQCCFGMTVGGYAIGRRRRSRVDPRVAGRPALVALRYSLMLVPILPWLLLLAADWSWVWDKTHTSWILAIAAALLVAPIWLLWNGISIARGKDAIYDRLAGMTVIALKPQQTLKPPPFIPPAPPPSPRR